MTNVSDEELKAFQKNHDADPQGIYVVEIHRNSNSQPLIGIFSNVALAKAWADDARRRLPEDEECRFLFCPYRLDDPLYGNERDPLHPRITRN